MVIASAQRNHLLPLVRDVALRFEVNPRFLDSLIVIESGYDPWAVRYEPKYRWLVNSDEYARQNNISKETEVTCQRMSWGLVQLMGGTARNGGYSGPLARLIEPELNLTQACLYLRSLQKRYDNSEDVVAAYNAGSPRRLGKGGDYVNQGYVNKFLSVYQSLEFD